MEYKDLRIKALEDEVKRLEERVEWLEMFKECIYHNDTILYESARDYTTVELNNNKL